MPRAIARRGQTPIRTSPSQLIEIPTLIARFLEDAAHYPGGRRDGVLRPRSIDEVSACLRDRERVLASARSRR